MPKKLMKIYGMFIGDELEYKGTYRDLFEKYGITNLAFYTDKDCKFRRKYNIRYLGKQNIEKEIIVQPKVETQNEKDMRIITNHLRMYGNVYYPKKNIESYIKQLEESNINVYCETSYYDKDFVILTMKG